MVFPTAVATLKLVGTLASMVESETATGSTATAYDEPSETPRPKELDCHIVTAKHGKIALS